MAGKVALPLKVEIAFTAGPLDTGTLSWTDVSAYVKRTRGVDFSRGTEPEIGEPMAGRLTFTLNNDDGRFTPGKTGAFGLVRPQLPVRVSALIGTANPVTYDDAEGWYDMLGATYDDSEQVLWTGTVDTWRIGWENGVRSFVEVVAVDRWAVIRRLRLTGQLSERVGTDQSPAHFWPGTDPSGSTRMVDTAGGVDFVGSAITGSTDYAAAANPQTWLTLPVAKHVAASSYAGPFMSYPGTDGWLPKGTASIGFTVAAWLDNASVTLLRGGGQSRVTIGARPATVLLYRVFGDPGSVYVQDATTPQFGWQHVAVTVNVNSSGAVTVKSYRNGVVFDTNTTAYTSGGWDYVMDSMTLEGPIAYLGIYDRALTAAELLAQYQAGSLDGWTGETADVRASRLVTYVDPKPTVTSVGTFTATMSKQQPTDRSLADALNECAMAERGTIYIGTDGWPRLASRDFRTSGALAFTIPATALSSAVSWALDGQQLVNSATVERMALNESAGSTTVKNDTSVATYGEQPVSLQVYVDTDAQAVERANAEANMFATPLPRSADLTVDVMAKNATIAATTLLGAEIGQRVAVSGMPATAPTQTQFYIDAIADRVTESGWERTLTVSPRLDFMVLDDATYGTTDSTNVLAF